MQIEFRAIVSKFAFIQFHANTRAVIGRHYNNDTLVVAIPNLRI